MLMRTLPFRSALGAAFPVAAAVFSLTCGGAPGRDDVTGPGVASAPAATDEATVVSALEKDKGREIVCHYDGLSSWVELAVPSQALAPHVPGHPDDFLKEADRDCSLGPPPAATCPCFTTADIDEYDSTSADLCGDNDTPNVGCQLDPYVTRVEWSCPAGTGAYLLQRSYVTYGDGCAVYGPEGTSVVEPKDISPEQHDACRSEIADSTPCGAGS